MIIVILVDVIQDKIESWSLSRVSKFGYLRGHATKEKLSFEVSILYLRISKMLLLPF